MFSFGKIQDKVYLVQADSYYDLANMFVRYQESYECPSDKFRGKSFSLAEYQSWYVSKYNKDVFTYPKDWAGYNVPDYVFERFSNIQDRTFYDDLLLGFINKVKSIEEDKFYIIGAKTGNEKTIKHELAHALYYVYPEYKEDVLKSIDKYPNLIQLFREAFLENGYCEDVVYDEMNAYMISGGYRFLSEEVEKSQEYEDLYRRLVYLFEVKKKNNNV